MYISRAEIPWQLGRNPYDLHRRLWDLFPGQKREQRKAGEEPRQGFLFRIEEQGPGKPIRILLQSRREPEPVSNISLLGTRDFAPTPEQGQQLGFLLTANPIKTITDAEKDQKADKRSDKCRVPLIHEEEQIAWLVRKLDMAAVVAPDDMSVLRHEPLHFRKGNRGGKLVSVTFQGLLKVRDPAALLNLLENGIGPAKAFGCGLLLVRRV